MPDIDLEGDMKTFGMETRIKDLVSAQKIANEILEDARERRNDAVKRLRDTMAILNGLPDNSMTEAAQAIRESARKADMAINITQMEVEIADRFRTLVSTKLMYARYDLDRLRAAIDRPEEEAKEEPEAEPVKE